MRLRLRLSLVGLLVFAHLVVASAAEIRTIHEFEVSAFARQRKPMRTSSWPLKTGGVAVAYSYVDFDSDSSCGVDFTVKGDRIEKFSVSWHGESRQQPARLTQRREAFLRELLTSLTSRADGGAIVAYVRTNQQSPHPAGVATAPERSVGGRHVKAGVTGSSLIVVLRF